MNRLSPRDLALGLCAVLLGLAAWGGHRANENLRADLSLLTPRKERLEQEIATARANEADAEALKRQINLEDLALKLAPPDKPRLLASLEATSKGLSLRNFKASFGAEAAAPALVTTEPGLAQSTVTLEGEAPDDLAVRAMAEVTGATLQGAPLLKTLSLARLLPDGGLSATNLSFKITFDWLANATPRSP